VCKWEECKVLDKRKVNAEAEAGRGRGKRRVKFLISSMERKGIRTGRGGNGCWMGSGGDGRQQGWVDSALCHDLWIFDEVLNRFLPEYHAKCASRLVVGVMERGVSGPMRPTGQCACWCATSRTHYARLLSDPGC
jgi:hypothetical protein